jgi:hypothetical protein
MLASKGIPFSAGVWNLFGLHLEYLLLGWMVQLTMGVAFWILPRFGSGAPRGKELLMYSAVVALNFDVWIVAPQPYLGCFGLPQSVVL